MLFTDGGEERAQEIFTRYNHDKKVRKINIKNDILYIIIYFCTGISVYVCVCLIPVRKRAMCSGSNIELCFFIAGPHIHFFCGPAQL